MKEVESSGSFAAAKRILHPQIEVLILDGFPAGGRYVCHEAFLGDYIPLLGGYCSELAFRRDETSKLGRIG